jgi:hypothetical protein
MRSCRPRSIWSAAWSKRSGTASTDATVGTIQGYAQPAGWGPLPSPSGSANASSGRQKKGGVLECRPLVRKPSALLRLEVARYSAFPTQRGRPEINVPTFKLDASGHAGIEGKAAAQLHIGVLSRADVDMLQPGVKFPTR